MHIDLQSSFFRKSGLSVDEAEITRDVLLGRKQGDIALSRGVHLPDVAAHLDNVRMKADIPSVRGAHSLRVLLKHALSDGLQIAVDEYTVERVTDRLRPEQKSALLRVACAQTNPEIIESVQGLTAFKLTRALRQSLSALSARDGTHAALIAVAGTLARGECIEVWPNTSVSVEGDEPSGP